MKKKKQFLLKAKIELLHKKSLFLSKKNEYNDYYTDLSDFRAGDNKVRPALISRDFPNYYFLVSFATSARVRWNKHKRKGSLIVKYNDVNYYFNPTDSYIFNRKILSKNVSNFIGEIPDDTLIKKIATEAISKSNAKNKANPELISNIIDALLIEDYETVDKLIELQFHKPTSEDIHKRMQVILDRRKYVKDRLIARKKKDHK